MKRPGCVLWHMIKNSFNTHLWHFSQFSYQPKHTLALCAADVSQKLGLNTQHVQASWGRREAAVRLLCPSSITDTTVWGVVQCELYLPHKSPPRCFSVNGFSTHFNQAYNIVQKSFQVTKWFKSQLLQNLSRSVQNPVSYWSIIVTKRLNVALTSHVWSEYFKSSWDKNWKICMMQLDFSFSFLQR